MVDYQVVQFCEVVIAIFIALGIGTCILKASCAVYNLLAGATGKQDGTAAEGHLNPELGTDREAASESTASLPGVPVPSFEWAMRILFFATIINTSGSFIILRTVRLAGLAAGKGTFTEVPVLLIFSPCGILVLGGLCAAMLPTRFVKGLLVSLLFHFLSLLCATVLAGVVVLIALAAHVRIPWTG